MRKLVLTVLFPIVFCGAPAGAEPPAMPYDGLEEFIAFVREVKQKIAIERVYQIGSPEELTLAPGQAARLRFTDNPGGVTEFLLFYDNKIVHVIYRCAGDTDRQYSSTALYTEYSNDSRTIYAENATAFLKVSTEWEPRDRQALVRFRAELPSEEELRSFRKWQEEQKKERERMEAVRRQAAAVREWDHEEQIAPFKILMDDPNDPNMVQLRRQYDLDGVVRNAADGYERLRRVLAWVQKRWQHSGNNEPSKPDPLTILKEAAEGKRFRCVEYAIVVAGCIRSLGLPARVVGLRRPDVEIAESGAGHVVAEVWLESFHKWVFVDGQWGAVVEKDGVPLNGMEFQDALARQAAGLKIRFVSGGDEEEYLQWILPYLYYLSFNFDQRFYGKDREEQRYMPRRGQMMLVPKGAKRPTVFQRNTPIGNCTYTSNPAAFYPLMRNESW